MTPPALDASQSAIASRQSAFAKPTADKSAPSTFDDDAWEDLLNFIEEKRVIPIVGPELAMVRTEAGDENLYAWLARQLAARLGQVVNGSAPSLNDVIVRHLAGHGRREDLYTITYLTKQLYDLLKPQWGNSAAAVPLNTPNFTTSAVFLIKDPNRRVLLAQIQADDGRIIQGPTVTSNTYPTDTLGTGVVVLNLGLGNTVPPDAGVRFYVGDPAAATRLFSFHLENIQLP